MEALQEEVINKQDLLDADNYTSDINPNTKVRRSRVKAAYLTACQRKNIEMKDLLAFTFQYINDNQELIANADKLYTVEDFYNLYLEHKENGNR